MPEDDPDTFEIFVKWMYAAHVNYGLEPMQCINVWIFAQKYQCIQLSNNAMDALQDALVERDDSGKGELYYDEVVRIFEHTTENDEYGLRPFAVATLGYDIKYGDTERLNGIETLEKIFKDVDVSLLEVLKYIRTNKLSDFNPRYRGYAGGFSKCHFHNHIGLSTPCPHS